MGHVILCGYLFTKLVGLVCG
jgi:hypothetical protein